MKQDPIRVTIKVPLSGTLKRPATAAPPAPPPAPAWVAAPAVRPRTAPVHIPVFDFLSSDEAIPSSFEENSNSDENAADLNLDAEHIARKPVGPLIADEIRLKQPEVHFQLVSSSSDDKMFPTLHQPQPAIVLLDFESPQETREEQHALTERKSRARPYHPKRKPEISAFKSPENYQQKTYVALK